MLIRTLTVQGSAKADNRDCATVFKKGFFHCFLLMDGATGTPDSGGFARQIRDELQRYMGSFAVEGLSLTQVNDRLIQALEEIQCKLQRQYLSDVVSLLLVIHHNGLMLANSWGDCLLGKVNQVGIPEWLTIPHTFANTVKTAKPISEIALDDQRHQLTRSFKARRYIQPDRYSIELKAGEKAILASDGFWACMSEPEQQSLLTQPYKKIEPVEDDVSVIIFKP